MTGTAVKKLLNEVVYIGFAVQLVLQFLGTTKVEDVVILIIVEMTFVGTRIYSSVMKTKQRNEENQKRYDKKMKKFNRS